MSQDRLNATQEPTLKRLRTAREEGNVATSSDLSTVLFLIVAVGLILVWTPQLYLFCKSILVENLSGVSTEPKKLIEQTGWEMFYLMLIPCIVLVAAAIFAGVVQVGCLFAPSVVRIRLSRVMFFEGARIFGARNRMNFLFSVAKLLLASGASLLVLLHYKKQLIELGDSGSLLEIVTQIGSIGAIVVFAALLVLLLLGLTDFCWKRYAWKSDLRMSRQEIIEENKENSGNAVGIRRHSAWLAKKCVEQVVPSLIVVGNKLAVSIRWNAMTMSAPVVLDVFQGDDFEKFSSRGHKSTPVVQDSSLATRIIRMSDVGLGIPPALHGEIASLLITNRRDER
jgi:flagellar biosynthetic protein FlhB